MKNIFFSLAFMLIGSFAFANNSVKIIEFSGESIKLEHVDISTSNSESKILKSCTYDIIDARTFKKVGEVTVTDVPPMLPCNDPKLMQAVNNYINN